MAGTTTAPPAAIVMLRSAAEGFPLLVAVCFTVIVVSRAVGLTRCNSGDGAVPTATRARLSSSVAELNQAKSTLAPAGVSLYRDARSGTRRGTSDSTVIV